MFQEVIRHEVELVEFVISQAEVQVAWEPHLQLVSEVGASSWHLATLVSELN